MLLILRYLVKRYLSKLCVRSFSFLGMVIDTVIRLPEICVFNAPCHTALAFLPSPSKRNRTDIAATCHVESGNCNIFTNVVMTAHLMINVVKNICIIDLQEVAKVEKREQPHQSLHK